MKRLPEKIHMKNIGLVEETGGSGENHLIPVSNSNYHNRMPAMAAIEKDIYFN
jgi:hypothetical protein